MTPNHFVVALEGRPMTAASQAKNTSHSGKCNKKNSNIKTREITGSNFLAEVELQM